MRLFHSKLHPRASAVDTQKIGPIGGMILIHLSEHAPTTAQAMAASLGRDKSQVSRIVSLLERKGLLEKSANHDDARATDLRLTEAGQLQVAAFNGALVETAKDIVSELSKGEVNEFSKLMARINSSNRQKL